MSMRRREIANYAPGWAPPQDGEDDLDLTRDQHPALMEKRAHLVAAGVGQLSSEMKSRLNNNKKRSGSVPASEFQNGRYGSNSYGNVQNSAYNYNNSRNRMDRAPPLPRIRPQQNGGAYTMYDNARNSFMPQRQTTTQQQGLKLPPHRNPTQFMENDRPLHLQNYQIQENSRGISVGRSKGLFDNMPLPRSADRRDPRHDPNYQDNGLGYGKNYAPMRREDDPMDTLATDRFDQNGVPIKVGKQEPSLSDHDEDSFELPQRINRKFDPTAIWGSPLKPEVPVVPLAAAPVQIVPLQQQSTHQQHDQSGPANGNNGLRNLDINESSLLGTSADKPQASMELETEPLQSPAVNMETLQSQQLQSKLQPAFRPSAQPQGLDQMTQEQQVSLVMALTDPARDRGQLQFEFSVIIDLPEKEALPVPMAVYDGDDIRVLCRCFRIAFSQGLEWETSLREYAEQLQQRHLHPDQA